MSEPTPNRRLTIFSLPTEVLDMIWDRVIEDCQLWVGPYGQQPQNGAMIRRYISEEASLRDNFPFPGHVLQYVHPIITNRFRQYLQNVSFDGLTLGEVHLIPAGLFDGIVNLALDMDQAILSLQVTVPNIRPTHSAVPPSTPLILTDAPGVQQLDIYWDTTVSSGSPDEKPIIVLLARLGYFQRSFRATVLYSAYEGTTVSCSGTLLDETTFTNHTARNDSEFATFRLHLNFLLWWPTILTMPADPWRTALPQYSAVIEAHPWHDSVPLGWHRIPRVLRPTDYRVHVTAPQRLTQRPYDT